MSKIFKIYSPIDEAFSVRRIVGSGGAATIARGTPTKQGSAGAVAIMADNEGTTSELFTGMAKTVSTDTASAAGEVYTYLPLPGLIYSGSPKTAAAANTAAKIAALQGSRVQLSLSGSDWGVDSAESDAIGNAVVIVGGDPNADILYFCMVHTMLDFFENN